MSLEDAVCRQVLGCEQRKKALIIPMISRLQNEFDSIFRNGTLEMNSKSKKRKHRSSPDLDSVSHSSSCLDPKTTVSCSQPVSNADPTISRSGGLDDSIFPRKAKKRILNSESSCSTHRRPVNGDVSFSRRRNQRCVANKNEDLMANEKACATKDKNFLTNGETSHFLTNGGTSHLELEVATLKKKLESESQELKSAKDSVSQLLNSHKSKDALISALRLSSERLAFENKNLHKQISDNQPKVDGFNALSKFSTSVKAALEFSCRLDEEAQKIPPLDVSSLPDDTVARIIGDILRDYVECKNHFGVDIKKLIEKLKDAGSRLQNQENLESKVADLKNEIVEKDIQIHSYENQVTKLATECSSAYNEIETLTRKLSDIETLQAQVSEYSRLLSAEQEKNTALLFDKTNAEKYKESIHENVLKEISQNEEKIRDLESRTAARNFENDSLRNQISKLEAELSISVSNTEMHSQKVSNLEHQCQTLQGEVGVFSRLFDAEREKNLSLIKEMDHLEKHLKEKDEKISRIQSALKSAEEKLAGISILETSNIQKDSCIDILKSKIVDLCSKVDINIVMGEDLMKSDKFLLP